MMEEIEDEVQEIKNREKQAHFFLSTISLPDKKKEILCTLVYMHQSHLQIGKQRGALHRPKKNWFQDFKI